MLTQVHCIGCGKILRIDAEKEQAICPKCTDIQTQNPDQDTQKLAMLARPPIKLAVEEYQYSLTPGIKRTLGSYLNCLYSILSAAGNKNTMREWCLKVGTDKFYEGVENNLLVLENVYNDDLEHRDEGYIIKEQPPQSTQNFKIDKIISNGNGAITAQITYNGKTGLLRVEHNNTKEEWTTDNLDMVDSMFCNNLPAMEQEMSSVGGGEAAPDSGPLRYQLKSRCTSALGYDAKGTLLYPPESPSIDLYA